ncbi:MAG: hypothetical protein ACWA41_09055 [Putridiphycobacter sp.]
MRFKIFTYLFCILAFQANAQTDSLFSLKIKELIQLFNAASYTPIQFSDTNIYVLRAISNDKSDKGNTYKSNYLEKQKELAEKDLGLTATGSYQENLNPTVADLNDNLVYNRKFLVGINWNILKNGYFNNQVEAKILEDRIQREILKNEQSNQSAYYLARFDQTIFTFNKLKIELLNERENALNKQHALIKELVLLKRLPKADLIRIESRLAEVQSLKQVYASYNDYLNFSNDSLNLSLDNLPLIDLNYNKIFETIENQTNEVLGNNAYTDYYQWYHQIGLKTYVRYNYYNLINSTYRSYVSFGLNLTVPLPFNTKLENEIAQEKWKYDNERLQNQRNSLHEDVLNVAYEFRYKLKQFIGFYQKRVLIEEKLRIEQVKVKLGDKNIDPMGALDLIDDIVSVDIELIDLLQNLYLKSLKIHSKIAYANIDDIVKSEPIHAVNEFAMNKKRAVYVWSKTFSDHSPEFLAEYTIYNNFNKVIVAGSKSDSLINNKLKYATYLDGKADYYVMLGNNKLFYNDSINRYISETLNQYDSIHIKGVHLDIEPHTFDEWKTNRMDLLNQYVDMVGKVSFFCKSNDLELDISIPLYYNPEIIDQLLNTVDHVYFMAYENVKNQYIQKKVNIYSDYAFNKIVIALRTEDFNNRIEMENKMDTLQNLTNVQNFVYHDLNRVINLDKANIKK